MPKAVWLYKEDGPQTQRFHNHSTGAQVYLNCIFVSPHNCSSNVLKFTIIQPHKPSVWYSFRQLLFSRHNVSLSIVWPQDRWQLCWKGLLHLSMCNATVQNQHHQTDIQGTILEARHKERV